MPIKTSVLPSEVEQLEVKLTDDALQEYTRRGPVAAMEELLWNSIDAEARNITVTFKEHTKTFVLTEVSVADDGTGISHDEARRSFGHLGDSHKKQERFSPKLHRPYHGHEGKGRYRAFAIGREIEWSSVSRMAGKASALTVRLSTAALTRVTIPKPRNSSKPSGCKVRITAINEPAEVLRSKESKQRLLLRLAPRLLAYGDINLVYDGARLNPAEFLVNQQELRVYVAAKTDQPAVEATLKILEWNRRVERCMFLCDENGVALDETTTGIKSEAFMFTAYLCSRQIGELVSDGTSFLQDMNPVLRDLKRAAEAKLKDYFRAREAESAADVVQRMKTEGSYPYQAEPTDEIERAERQVFDICAVKIHTYLPSISETDNNTRRLMFGLVGKALENNPADVQRILTEVLSLNTEQQHDLAEVIETTGLSGLIRLGRLVSDRLQFLNGLEQILHKDGIKQRILERAHLHRILAQETWIFGEMFALGGDDNTLKTVLEKHLQILERTDLATELTPDRVKDLNDVLDLMLYRQIPIKTNDRDYEHLVVELKRPTVDVLPKHIDQIERYASKVVSNALFDRARTYWHFWIVCNDFSPEADYKLKSVDREPGVIAKGEGYVVRAVKWAQVLQPAKVRLHFLRECFSSEALSDSRGWAFLQKKHAEYLPSVFKKAT
ncbi:MAG TPA: ATP-binding protein [Planctomycetota bacterium]|nr:ATP-binding protein [Planctomycetota bacterium]